MLSLLPSIKITKQDKSILNSYKSVVQSLAAYLGTSYEIVLHSLEDTEHSVIEIANGFHTGREIGAPITDLAVAWLNKIQKNKEKVDYYSYFSRNRKGEPMKSSTIAIRGNKDQVIGLLCINLYLGTPFLQLVSDMIPQENTFFASENFIQGPNTVEIELNKAMEIIDSNSKIPRSQRKKEIIRILQQHCVFDIKNAVDQVAKKLDISVNTVYFHLRNIRKEI